MLDIYLKEFKGKNMAEWMSACNLNAAGHTTSNSNKMIIQGESWVLRFISVYLRCLQYDIVSIKKSSCQATGGEKRASDSSPGQLHI